MKSPDKLNEIKKHSLARKTGSYGAQANGGKRHFVHIHEGNLLCITQANRSHRQDVNGMVGQRSTFNQMRTFLIDY